MTINFELLSLGIQAQFTYQASPSVILVGQCGVGKNKGGVEPIAAALRKALVYIPIPRYEPADFNGYPVPCHETKTVMQYPPAWAKTVADNGASNFVIFLDELSDADSKTLAACHGMLQDGHIADLNVSGAAFVCAMNPPEISTTGGTISHGIGNRSFIINWEPARLAIAKQMRDGCFVTPEPVALPAD